MGIIHNSCLFNKENIIIFLDAHFYIKGCKNNKERFVVLQELEKLKNTKNVILIIHDFDNGLGHITYDGISLDMNLLRKDLLMVNPNFHFYTNELSSCDIVDEKGKDVRKMGLPYDKEMKSTLKFVHSKPVKTFRGLLYCLPKRVKIEGLKEIK